MTTLQSSVLLVAPHDHRVSWLLDIAGPAADALICEHWTPRILDLISAGTGPDGQRLPLSANVAGDRLGMKPAYPGGVYVPSRVDRLIRHKVISTLRTLAVQDAEVRRQTSTTTNPGKPSYATAGYAQNIARQLGRYTREHPDADAGGLRLTDLVAAPVLVRLFNLGAVDSQLARISVEGDSILLQVKLPRQPAPAERSDWEWVEFEFAVPAHLRLRPILSWHLPTLTVRGGKVEFRFAYTETVPEPVAPKDYRTVVGVDWSPSTFAAYGLVEQDNNNGLSGSYRTHTYDDRGLAEKARRLQIEGGRLRSKIARLEALATGANPQTRETLNTKISLLRHNEIAVGAKRQSINREMAFHFASIITDFAKRADAHAIAVEDLTTLTPGNGSAVNNNKTSQSARRQGLDALTHTAARSGIDVIIVHAAGTSARCPSCDNYLERPGGYYTGLCKPCHLAGHRDMFAHTNIAKRAITGKNTIKRLKNTKRLATGKIIHAPVKPDRTKTGPTPKRPRHKRARNTTRTNAAPTTTPNTSPAPQRRRGTRPTRTGTVNQLHLPTRQSRGRKPKKYQV